MRRHCLSILLLTGVAANSADAQSERSLRYNNSVSVPITAIGLTAWIGLSRLMPQSMTDNCRWCDADLVSGERSVNAIDRFGLAQRWKNPARAAHLSDVNAYLLMPVGLGIALASEPELEGATLRRDGLIVLEAVAVAGALNQISKYAFRRRRPLSWTDPSDVSRDRMASFYSGHASASFALAVSAGTVASLRGSSHAPLVWGIGLPLAALSAYLRVAADKHYLSDVLAGAAMGSLVGWVMPYALHREAAPTVAANPSQLSFMWTW